MVGFLPTAVVAKRRGVGRGEVASTATTAATPAAVTTVVTTASAVADHLGETGINLLLGLSKDGDQVTSLLRICERDAPLVSCHRRGV